MLYPTVTPPTAHDVPSPNIHSFIHSFIYLLNKAIKNVQQNVYNRAGQQIACSQQCRL